MIEHIGNCHGEWSLLFGSVPFIGIWLKAWLVKRHIKKHHS